MYDYQPERRGGCGLLLSMIMLILGVGVGIAGTLAILGLTPSVLIGRVQGQSGPLIVPSPQPTAPVAIAGAQEGRRILWSSPFPLDTDTREPDMVLINRNYDSGTDQDTLVYISPDTQTVRWESAPLGKDGNGWQLAQNDQTLLIADKTRLIALNLADGQRRWEAPISDVLFSGCQDCIQTFGAYVVVLSDDGVVQAFNAASGAPLWQLRLRETTRQLLRVGDQLGVIDSESKDSSAAVLFLLNPADGSIVSQLKPTCRRDQTESSDTARIYDKIFADPQSGALHWLLDGASCLVRADPQSGQFTTVPLPDDIYMSDVDYNNILFADGTVYLGVRSSLLAIDLNGNLRTLANEQDYELLPLQQADDTLLVLANRQRGSSRLELWVLDPESGKRRFEHILKATNPVGEGFDSGDWSARLIDDSLALIEKTTDPEQLRYERIRLDDGASTVRQTIPAKTLSGDIRGILWGNQTVFITFDQLFSVDLEGGATKYQWP